jgi:hypothetical protein
MASPLCLYNIETYDLTFIIVALDTGTNFPAVSLISLLAILMTKLRQWTNGRGVPTQSQPQAASLTLSACNVAKQNQKGSRKKFIIIQHLHLLLNNVFYKNRTSNMNALNFVCI